MLDKKPNIIVFGVGHSGTSIVTKMLFELGWERNDADLIFCESVSIRKVNQALLRNGESAQLLADARAAIQAFRQPFALKDPRMVVTLPFWIPVFREFTEDIAMVRINRNHEKLLDSYRQRNELTRGLPSAYGRPVDDLLALSDQRLAEWPFAKITCEYESIAAAVSLFGFRRRMRAKGGLWLRQ